MSPWIASAIIIVVTCCDALRDRWSSRNVEWWKWHIVKWIAFFVPLVALTVLFVPILYWIFLAAFCSFLWNFLYRFKA